MEKSYLIPSLNNGIVLLFALAQSEVPLTLVQLCALTKISKTTAFRCLYTLGQHQLVQKNIQNNTYQVDIGVLRLGFWQLSKLEFATLGQPVLNKLRDDTGYSANITLRDHRDAVYIACAPSNKVISTGIKPGARLPVYATAVGRILVSHLSYDEFITLYEDPIIQEKQYPSRDRAQLWALLQHDRANGFAVSESFFQHGISTIVYPILRNKVVMAAVSITLHADHIEKAQKESLKARVYAASQELSELMQLTG